MYVDLLTHIYFAWNLQYKFRMHKHVYTIWYCAQNTYLDIFMEIEVRPEIQRTFNFGLSIITEYVYEQLLPLWWYAILIIGINVRYVLWESTQLIRNHFIQKYSNTYIINWNNFRETFASKYIFSFYV